MNKYRSYFPMDESPQEEGDIGWTGVDCRQAPGQLGPGVASDAENIRMDTRRPDTRGGAWIMPWAANRQELDGPGIVRPFTGLRTGGPFLNPISAVEWQVLVTQDKAYRIRPGTQAREIPVGVDLDLDTSTDLVQTYDGLILLRGSQAQPLYLQKLDEGFKAIPEPDAGLEAMPPVTQGIYFQNRFIGVDARLGVNYSDSFWVSDFGGIRSVLQGSSAYQGFKINRGASDRLVAGFPFNEFTLLAFKTGSVHVVTNVTGTNDELAQNAKLDTVTVEYGCNAPRSIVQVGKDVWFLGHKRGICSIRQTEQNKIQGADIPKSLEIEGWINRINWYASSNAVAAVHNNRVFFAVPTGSSTGNNAVLVYSTKTQSWQSFDTGPAHNILRWTKFTWGGSTRLGYLSGDGFVYCYEYGHEDHTGTAEGVITHHPITSRFRTRAYGGLTPGHKHDRRWTMGARTLGSTVRIDAIPDGAHEERLTKTFTRDRRLYHRPHGAADYDPLDPADDAQIPFRQDYSTALDFVLRPEERAPQVDLFQETEESGRLRRNAHSLQLEITSSTGRLQIASVTVPAQRGSTRDGSRS